MIAVDTNVLARYIVRDAPAESRIATRVIEGMCSADEPGFVGLVVLCELVLRRTTITFDRRAIDGDLFSAAPKTS